MESTCWTLVQGAARGDDQDRESFAWRYAPVIRAYFDARWRGRARSIAADDAVQEVFYECFRAGGILEKVERRRQGGFRAFLFGLARNVALRYERERSRSRERFGEHELDVEEIAAGEDEVDKHFDRAWARSLLREAAALQTRQARAQGADAVRRVELLHLRFYKELPIREIARRWDEDPQQVHRQYARARQEFRDALESVTRFYSPDDPLAARHECDRLLEAFTGD